MFEIGEFIVHGNAGVCKVEQIGALSTSGVDKNRLYYTLSPCYTSGSKIYVPVDSSKVMIRPVIDKEMANVLINDFSDIDCLWIMEEKLRENNYKESIKKCDCRELIRIIKTIYQHKQKRIEQGKKVTAVDGKYLKMAEDRLFGELAVSMDMDKEEVKNYFIKAVENI